MISRRGGAINTNHPIPVLIEVDSLRHRDLSTRPEHRRAGHAGRLLDWMFDEAARLGCGEFHLDSATTLERADAHRLYMNKGMRISAYHFQCTLPLLQR
jgi:GNAT superfamily N-acetyltransferase